MPNQQIIEVSTKGKQVSSEQQGDDKDIELSTKGQSSNKFESSNKLKQENVIPAAAGELEAVKENDETVTADSALRIDDENASNACVV